MSGGRRGCRVARCAASEAVKVSVADAAAAIMPGPNRVADALQILGAKLSGDHERHRMQRIGYQAFFHLAPELVWN
jgi:hypothetical protein